VQSAELSNVHRGDLLQFLVDLVQNGGDEQTDLVDYETIDVDEYVSISAQYLSGQR
jgi:hypothetical protein